MSRRPSQVSQAVLAWALTDPDTVARYRQMIEVVPGWTCAWCTGALSGRGHGCFWLASVDGRDVAIIAHRFGFALEHGREELLAVPLLGHRCDNPLCQLIAPGTWCDPAPGRTGASGRPGGGWQAARWPIGVGRAAGPGRSAMRSARAGMPWTWWPRPGSARTACSWHVLPLGGHELQDLSA